MLDTTHCQEHLDKVIEFSKSLGAAAAEQLQSKLDYLGNYACNPEQPDKTKCELYKDFAPQSFCFSMYRKSADGSYNYWFNGGLIFFNDKDDPNWSVHT